MSRLRTWLPSLLFIAFATFIAWMIWTANSGQGDRYWGFLSFIPFADKLGHGILMGMLCLLLNLALRCKTVGTTRIRILLGTLLVAIFVLVEEISQVFLPNRSFDLGDLFADALGILLASRLASFLAGRRTAAITIAHLKQPDTCPKNHPR